MGIAWDEDQITSIAGWLETHVPLQGQLIVIASDVEEGSFAAYVSLTDKHFVVHTNVASRMSEAMVNVTLAYAIALAYDATEWQQHPTKEMLIACLEKVANSLADFNTAISDVVRDQVDVIEYWVQHIQSPQAMVDEGSADELVDEMSNNLFTPAQEKKWIN